MKITRAEGIAMGITLAVLLFAAGILVGRSTVQSGITVSTAKTVAQASAAEAAETTEAVETAEVTASQEASRLNLNDATLEELEELPKIGPVLAQRILDYRAELGGFLAVEELLEVPGIGEKIYDEIYNLVEVGN